MHPLGPTIGPTWEEHYTLGMTGTWREHDNSAILSELSETDARFRHTRFSWARGGAILPGLT